MDKIQILALISKLPTIINLPALYLNVFSKKFYGRGYNSYITNTLHKHYYKYDNRNTLLKIVNNAIEKIPYYKKLYSERIQSFDEFSENIGFINKDIVMKNVNDFIDPNINMSQYIKGTTGGTSGKPLQFIMPENRYIFELATMHSMWQTTGWNYNIRAVIKNDHLPKKKDFIINPILKEFIFDGFRLNNEYFNKIYKILRCYKIGFIHSYPSSAYQFCVYLKENNLDVSFIKAFLTGSENVFDYQSELIEKTLGIRFYNWFGHSEKLVLGGYCKHSNNYHIEPSYGYFELIDDCNNIITTPGKVGEIVGTTLKNYGMSLIRYRTGDFAEYVGSECKHCGRQLPLIKDIKGRWSGEKVYDKDGDFVTTTALNLHNSLYAVINGHQYVQKKKGELNILIIKSKKYKKRHELELLQHYKSKFNKDMKIEICYVDKLIKQSNGKFLHLINECTKDYHQL